MAKGFHIWVDADATPAAVKDILFRAAARTGHPTTFVANQPVQIPKGGNVDFILVSPGFDVADSEIVKRMHAGDLVITGDIPLAADVIEKGGHALDPRGVMYDPGSIKEKLAMRDFLSTLRDTGVIAGGPSSYGPGEKRAFANKLDSFLAKVAKS